MTSRIPQAVVQRLTTTHAISLSGGTGHLRHSAMKSPTVIHDGPVAAGQEATGERATNAGSPIKAANQVGRAARSERAITPVDNWLQALLGGVRRSRTVHLHPDDGKAPVTGDRLGVVRVVVRLSAATWHLQESLLRTDDQGTGQLTWTWGRSGGSGLAESWMLLWCGRTTSRGRERKSSQLCKTATNQGKPLLFNLLPPV